VQQRRLAQSKDRDVDDGFGLSQPGILELMAKASYPLRSASMAARMTLRARRNSVSGCVVVTEGVTV